jgi:hypothetical protein
MTSRNTARPTNGADAKGYCKGPRRRIWENETKTIGTVTPGCLGNEDAFRRDPGFEEMKKK